MKCYGECKFLGVSNGKNERGDYYRISLFDDSGDSMRLYCTEEVYNAGMLIPFGKECSIELSARSYNGKNFLSVEDITEK